MQLIKDPKIDWLSMKWIFMGFSLILLVLGSGSIAINGGLRYGVDFTGGALMYLKFMREPPLEAIRKVLSDANLPSPEVTLFDDPAKNEIQIRLGRVEAGDAEDVDQQRREVMAALKGLSASPSDDGQLDLNSVTQSVLAERLSNWASESGEAPPQGDAQIAQWNEFAGRVIEHRTENGGLIRDFSELESLNPPAGLLEQLRNRSYLSDFVVLSNESVGPKVGEEYRNRARLAIIFSLMGMLAYITVRFQFVYGLAAIVALFHDVLLTVGLLSLANKEITLTVVAAILTLVGYSLNDTIVVFDRVRENLRLMRRNSFTDIINTSINQTLNRTLLTSGMTFVAVFALYLLGGEALSAFSFALVIGIIVGTYSSVAIASPVVLWWQDYYAQRAK